MTSQQIVILNSVTEPDGSFYVTGVFWLSAPSNSIISLPNLQSQVPFISTSDLASLRSGNFVEQSFNSGLFASGTASTTVQSTLQTQYTTAQTNLTNTNPALSGLVSSVYNGTTWGSYGSSTPTLPTTNFNIPIHMDIGYATAFGYIPNITSNRATGYVSTGAISGVPVRATTYTPQGVNAQRSLKSSSANDTAAGTGARTVIINYLNTSFQLKQDTITLNGTTAVNTNATDIAFIESLVVATVGTQGGGNAGTISLFTATAGGGSAWASIAIGDNITYYAHHYVPSGVTCYLLNVSGGATLSVGAITINRSGNPLSSNLPQVGIGGSYPHLGGGNTDHDFSVPVAIPGPDFIWLVERPATISTSTTYATFEYIQF